MSDNVYSWLKRGGAAGWENEISHSSADNLIKDIFCCHCLIFGLAFLIILSLFQCSC